MKKTRWAIILVLLAGLMASVSLSGAQEGTNSLRALAEKNDIFIGTAVFTYHLSDPTHYDIVAREFNMLTPENEAKMCELQPERGKFDFTRFDQLVDYAEQHNMAIHGHTLLWHQCMPDWVASGSFSREEAIGILRDHIYTVVGRYKGRIPIWDVVNEAWADNGTEMRDIPWLRLIGEDYVELAFQFAHEADPDAVLFYNDYGAEGLNNKSNSIYAMLSDFVARGVPVHGVGLQAHIDLNATRSGGSASPDVVGANMQRLGELGLQVQITEMDVKFKGEPTEEIFRQQAGDYWNMANTCLESDYCTAFIVWGVADHYSWLKQADFVNNPAVDPLMFDKMYQPKPAYFAVLDVLARHAGEPPVLSDEELAAILGGDEPVVVAVPEPTRSDPAQLAPDSVPGAVYYAPFPVTVALDGDTADWDNVPRVTIDSGPVLPANHDTAMTFAVAADETNLYFLADIRDSKLVYGLHDPATGWYEEDSIEFYLNTTGDLGAVAYEPGIVQIGIMAANITHPDAPIIGGGNSASSQVSVYAVETENGYLIEASVPLVTGVWTIIPTHEAVLGFQAHLNGASGESRDTKLIWSVYDTQDQSYNNPSLFGQLVFWDKTK